MKKILALTLILAAFALPAFDFAGQEMEALLDAIAEVESGNNPNAVGDRGKAVGAYQLHEIYVAECNRIAKTAYTAADRYDPIKSRDIARRVLTYWGKRLEKDLGRAATAGDIAKIHNGFRWWKRPAAGNEEYFARLAKYEAKVLAVLKKQGNE